MLIKKNVYTIMNGSTFSAVENFNVVFTNVGPRYFMMQPNMHIRFKSLLGMWICVDGLWTGE